MSACNYCALIGLRLAFFACERCELSAFVLRRERERERHPTPKNESSLDAARALHNALLHASRAASAAECVCVHVQRRKLHQNIVKQRGIASARSFSSVPPEQKTRREMANMQFEYTALWPLNGHGELQ